MKIDRIEVNNFRLLKDIQISLEDMTTVIVGRNNSGKTSLIELFRRILSANAAPFLLEDFSLTTHEEFWNAFLLYQGHAEEDEIRKKFPTIEVKLFISYDMDTPDLGALSDFIIDLNASSLTAVAVIRYQLKEGGIEAIFQDIPYAETTNIEDQKKLFFKMIRDRIPKFYVMSLIALDPNDSSNQKKLELTKLRSLIHVGFINAQRGLDDVTDKEKDMLGKVLEKLLTTASTETATEEDRLISMELESIVQDIQQRLDTDFNNQLSRLLPALKLFGYPGLNDPNLHTETTLDIQRLLDNHTKLRYRGANGIGLPETYNGLGSRNLIYILLKLFEFFKSFQAEQIAPVVSLMFIEEPEAHLHPQMQEVFVRKIGEIANFFVSDLNNNQSWPVQFIITTHSTHIANEAPFQAIRYFLNKGDVHRYTCIKDLREGFDASSNKHKDFLHKYLTLTRCDLFFADKAILIEGPTERIMMPRMIEKTDSGFEQSKLRSQYVSLIEVGGAYAHHFFQLLDFLELRTLIITDLDSVKKTINDKKKTVYPACKVVEGTHTSNSGIKKWFGDDEILLEAITTKSNKEKIKNFRRITYQIPEDGATVCGRSFEDAFILANLTLFEIKGDTDNEKIDTSWDIAEKIKKTDFAIKYAVDETNWNVPLYIGEGLQWLSENTDVISEGLEHG